MADDLTDDERELLEQHRAAKRKPRNVKVRGRHEDAEYEFDLDGDEADKVIARHRSLWADDEPDTDDKPKGGAKGKPDDDGKVTRFGRRVS